MINGCSAVLRRAHASGRGEQVTWMAIVVLAGAAVDETAVTVLTHIGALRPRIPHEA